MCASIDSMGESRVYMNFYDFHASTERLAEALNIARSWSAEKIRSQLAKNAVSACYLIEALGDCKSVMEMQNEHHQYKKLKSQFEEL